MVVDEFGTVTGVLTVEDVLEQIVGEIQDEFDAEATQFIRKSEGVWEISGTLPLHDLEKIIGTVEHDDSVATASGWVTEKLGGFPKTGDTFALGALLDVEWHIDTGAAGAANLAVEIDQVARGGAIDADNHVATLDAGLLRRAAGRHFRYGERAA